MKYLYTKGSRVSWRDLADKEKMLIPNEAGAGFTAKSIMWLFDKLGFEFGNYNFSQHDMYYAAGGNIFDKIKADTLMLLYMQVDSFYQKKKWQGFSIFFVVAPLAFVTVSTVGLFIFRFGDYWDKKKLLNHFKGRLAKQ